MSGDKRRASAKPRASNFCGQQAAREPLYEAHIFIIVEPGQEIELRRDMRRYGFRLSPRPKTTKAGMIDILATKNGDERAAITNDLRDAADALAGQGYCVYRIRLEQMIFDESDRFARSRRDTKSPSTE
jgi:hypothetical protein